MSFKRFGIGFVLSDGDLVATVQGGLYTIKDYEQKNAALAKFEGYFQVLFMLTDRLLTPKGDNVFHPEYGSNLYKILSRPNSPSTKSAIETEVTNTLLEDPLVDEIEYVTVEQRDNMINVKASIKVIGQDSASIFAFPNFFLE